ncbi:MAG: adenosine deaminase [Thauera phenolivorans]|uniref:Adenine deaminase n=1 Tax=Thauera phenolivorans TaxID=1792543 RepID=A0A7X7R711_9RHOO|nr:adenosine deaminase [Thauera phenolivorans]NLF53024.1 adenosine deaminase [Thauera phenolivorans]
MDLDTFVRALPKAELHLHIEGTLEPELMFALAARNRIALPWKSVEETRAAYAFSDLQSFLDLYYAGAAALCHEQDFFELAMAYFARAHADGVVHAELFFDPQTHTARGVAFETVLDGLERACRAAQARYGISSRLILCFLRHLSEDEGFAALEAAQPHLARLHGVGLDSSEKGHPPAKFVRLFARCRELGLHLVAHAGEEGPPAYIVEALELLGVERIDHGVRAAEDPALLARLAREQVPLTVCPLSNVKLRVFPNLAAHNLKALLDAGLKVTINSDDPAYFGGYIAQNYIDTAEALGLSRGELKRIARNSLEAAFVTEAERAPWLRRLATLPD